ncbi:MAG: 2-hydroxyacyl-CoA dehydratase family protein, partial [Polyangiaceae bacterium]|nr:2-hydroxyacyl-CoA dehydratase family protein [Polyangiaceae bacterium]
SLLERYLDMGLDHIDGFVFVASCDHVRRLVDNMVYLQEPAFHFILDLPHKAGEPAIAWYTQELERLCCALAEHFEVALDRERLCLAIEAHNEHLDRLRALDELRLRNPPAISGADFHRLLIASATAPKRQLAPVLAQVLAACGGSPPGKAPRARLMVLGSTLDDPAYLSTMESVGGAVVADRFCFGGMPGLAPVVCGEDPLDSLARHALSTTQCPRMMGGFEARMDYIIAMVRARQVDGVVLETMKFCDLWGVEGSLTADALRQAGIPVLRVEREVASLAEGQLRTRVQALLEALGR